jgi:hypothetical protein
VTPWGSSIVLKYDGNLRQLHSSILLARLANGWTERRRAGLTKEFLRRWEGRLNTTIETLRVTANTVLFAQDLRNIHLRGMHEVPSVLLGGNSLSQSQVELLRNITSPGKIPFILTLSKECHRQVMDILPAGGYLLLSPDETLDVMSARQDIEGGLVLKRLLLQQIPKARLNPYDLLKPAEGAMFFGRENEFARLVNEEETSLAISGPGRIGKTSLLQRYKRELVRRKDLRLRYCHLISFYDCKDTSADGISQFIAMQLTPSSRSFRMTTHGLLSFLKYESRDRPLDLLLDEVDTVCDSEAFKMLGAAARAGYCRLVLSGRGVLLRSMLRLNNPLESRIDLIQLGPLDHLPARELVLRPFSDMNIKFKEPEAIADQVLRFTGCLPYQLQFFCLKLMELAIEKRTDTISSDQIEAVKQDFVVAQYFLNPIVTIEDPETRLIGLLMLSLGKRRFSIPDAQMIGDRAGLHLDFVRVLDICNDLVINNVFSWSAGCYEVATDALFYYARQMNYLERAIEETYKILREQGKTSKPHPPKGA